MSVNEGPTYGELLGAFQDIVVALGTVPAGEDREKGMAGLKVIQFFMDSLHESRNELMQWMLR